MSNENPLQKQLLIRSDFYTPEYTKATDSNKPKQPKTSHMQINEHLIHVLLMKILCTN